MNFSLRFMILTHLIGAWVVNKLLRTFSLRRRAERYDVLYRILEGTWLLYVHSPINEPNIKAFAIRIIYEH